ncbi:CLUMA_CG004305, isoform A, partial [Clunio marinus]
MLTSQYTKTSSGSLVVSNTFPSLLSNPKRMDITSILQLVTKYRTESCCASLISCLLVNCRADLQYEDNESDTSSLQIFHALTREMSQSEEFIQHQIMNETKEIKSHSNVKKPVTVDATHIDDSTIDFFDKLTNEGNERNVKNKFIRSISEGNDENELLGELIRAEEIFIAHIIAKCLKFCPSAFDGEITKSEVMMLIEKASRFLWTHVSSTLEHFVLWWNAAPLACRPIGCTKYLREWLLMQSNEAPEPILSTLKSLGEILTIHVIGCLWDKQFRNCLVFSQGKPDQKFNRNSEFYSPPEEKGTTCGYFWNELLQSLVTITNSCDRAGTIANELPLTEQIPVLHRLDHSIHTMRLWTVTKAKELCCDWNMKIFFKVVNYDMERCLEHLNDLRLPALVCTNPLLEVHINVNVALREKLVSEVKTNRDKAKKTTCECINNIFAHICDQTSLATLKIYFPPVKIWRVNHLKTTHNQYIEVYLDLIYLPIIEATEDLEILSLALKIICEALLEHIYAKRIKFSICGAINLMKDFEGIANWIESCKELPLNYRDKLSRHEVLKVCEGVGKILLRQPDEIICLEPPKAKGEKGSATDD